MKHQLASVIMLLIKEHKPTNWLVNKLKLVVHRLQGKPDQEKK